VIYKLIPEESILGPWIDARFLEARLK